MNALVASNTRVLFVQSCVFVPRTSHKKKINKRRINTITAALLVSQILQTQLFAASCNSSIGKLDERSPAQRTTVRAQAATRTERIAILTFPLQLSEIMLCCTCVGWLWRAISVSNRDHANR